VPINAKILSMVEMPALVGTNTYISERGTMNKLNEYLLAILVSIICVLLILCALYIMAFISLQYIGLIGINSAIITFIINIALVMLILMLLK